MLSYLFTYLFIFGWLPNMVNFTLLGARYFPFLYIFLCFVLGCNLVTWKQFETFNSYFYDLLGSERNAQSGWLFPKTEARSSWVYSPRLCEGRVSQATLWEQALLLARCAHQALFPVIPSGDSFTSLEWFAHMHIVINTVLLLEKDFLP